jgi:hypothetical protein
MIKMILIYQSGGFFDLFSLPIDNKIMVNLFILANLLF